MRKLLLSLVGVAFMTGLVAGAEVTLKGYDRAAKKLTVADEKGKDATYTITDKTRIVRIDKDGNAKDVKLSIVEKMLTSEKAIGKAKFDITTDKDQVTEIKFKRKK